MALQRPDIAKALVAMLQTASNNATIGNYTNPAGSIVPLAFTAQMQYVPAVKPETLLPLTLPLVTVAPMGTEKRRLYSRGSMRKDFVLTIGVQKKLLPTTNPKSPQPCPEVDGLMQAVDVIAAYLEPPGGAKGQLPVTSGIDTGVCTWVETDIASYNVQHMIEDGVFTSYVVVTYAYT